jgi:acetoin utilization protein AcuB
MHAVALIDSEVKFCSPEQKVSDVYNILQESSFNGIYLVNNKHEVTGYYSLSEIREVKNKSQKIAEITPHQIIFPLLKEDTHFFELLHIFSKSKLRILPVVNDLGAFIGCVSLRSLTSHLSDWYSVTEQGGILILEMDTVQYSLAEISRLIESNDTKILGLELSKSENGQSIYVHIKLNTTILKNILSTFERFNYKIVAYFHREDEPDDTIDRYGLLMKYLDI